MPADLHTELHGVVAERLQGREQRYTANRRAVVEVLASTDRPLTIQQLLDRADGLPQSSAYRNLTVLEDTGVVHRVAGSDEFARFELAEDLTDHHHHHLICSACGSIEDFTVGAELEKTIEETLDRAATEAGFQVDNHRLDLVGHCRRCA